MGCHHNAFIKTIKLVSARHAVHPLCFENLRLQVGHRKSDFSGGKVASHGRINVDAQILECWLKTVYGITHTAG